jgi:hypothetical protein
MARQRLAMPGGSAEFCNRTVTVHIGGYASFAFK